MASENNQQQSEGLKIPPILRPLLESFAREALQNQPDDLVCGFDFKDLKKQIKLEF